RLRIRQRSDPRAPLTVAIREDEQGAPVGREARAVIVAAWDVKRLRRPALAWYKEHTSAVAAARDCAEREGDRVPVGGDGDVDDQPLAQEVCWPEAGVVCHVLHSGAILFEGAYPGRWRLRNTEDDLDGLYLGRRFCFCHCERARNPA